MSKRSPFAAMAAASTMFVVIACGNAKPTDTPAPAPAIIAYGDKDGYAFTIRPDGTDRKQILADKGRFNPPTDVSDDGRLLTFTLANGVWIMNSDGSGARRLTDSGYGAVFNPTGGLLAYTDADAVYVVDSDGGEPRFAYQPPEIGRGGPGSASVVAVSPDGTKLLVSEFGMIVEVGIDGSNRRVVLQDQFTNTPTGYSPDGSEILFTSDRSGHYMEDVFVVRADGSDIRTLVAKSRGAEYSPDGKHIVYVAWADFNVRQLTRIFIMNADGTQSRPLTPESQSANNPKWGGTG